MVEVRDAPVTERTAKFRQAAFVYLHVGLLYEFSVYVMWTSGVLPPERGPIWLWLILGALILAAVFAGLWWWQNVWFARVIWALHALRLPFLIEGAYFTTDPALDVPGSFYALAIVLVLINLGFLARAGWDV